MCLDLALILIEKHVKVLKTLARGSLILANTQYVNFEQLGIFLPDLRSIQIGVDWESLTSFGSCLQRELRVPEKCRVLIIFRSSCTRVFYYIMECMYKQLSKRTHFSLVCSKLGKNSVIFFFHPDLRSISNSLAAFICRRTGQNNTTLIMAHEI